MHPSASKYLDGPKSNPCSFETNEVAQLDVQILFLAAVGRNKELVQGSSIGPIGMAQLAPD